MTECAGCQKVLPLLTCNDCGFEYCKECMLNPVEHTPCSTASKTTEQSEDNDPFCNICEDPLIIPYCCFCPELSHKICRDCFVGTCKCLSCDKPEICSRDSLVWCMFCEVYYCKKCICHGH